MIIVSGRTEKSIKNISYALVGQVSALIISFILRMVFVNSLGKEYLGVDSLFISIVSMLSLAELGVGSAINYSLYKPIADNDVEKIKSLMFFYKKIYSAIGVIIFVIGIIITPLVINSNGHSIENIGLFFIIFVLNSSLSYFYSYKKTLVVADQHRHITIVYRYFFYFVMVLIQCLFLLIYKSYLAYLVTMLIFTFLENYSMSKKADKLYPYLKDKTAEYLTKGDKREILKNTYAMSFHKIGGVVVNSTDNIVITKFLGLSVVGIYSNFLLITNSLNMIFGQIFSSVIASVGNLGVAENSERVEKTFETIFFYCFLVVSFSTVMLITLLNPFVKLWVGESFAISEVTIVFIGLNFFIVQIRRAVLTFRDALGLYWFDRYKPLIESLLNILLSIYFVKLYGLSGVLIGTIISMILTSVWIEPYVLYKHAFNKNPFGYLLKLIFYTSITVLLGFISLLLKKVILGIGISNYYLEFLILGFSSMALFLALFLIIFFRNKHLKQVFIRIKNKVLK